MGGQGYALPAAFWGCFFGDRAEEATCWATLAARYGRRVLAPMAATGEVAYLISRQGFTTVAVDLSQGMVDEGQRRFPQDPQFKLVHGDVTALTLTEPAFDFAFLGNGDFHHFLDAASQTAVLTSLHGQLRSGGAIGMELFLPAASSWVSPRRRFAPLRPPTDDRVQVWKQGETRFGETDGRLEIRQTLSVKRDDVVTSFAHAVSLKLHHRTALLELLSSTGFDVEGEYGSYVLAPWHAGAERWILVAEKRMDYAADRAK